MVGGESLCIYDDFVSSMISLIIMISFVQSFLFSSALAILSYKSMKYLKKFDQKCFFRKTVGIVVPLSLFLGFLDYYLTHNDNFDSKKYFIVCLSLCLPTFGMGFWLAYSSYYK